VQTSKKILAMMVAMQGQQQQLEQKVIDLSTTVNKKIDDLVIKLDTDRMNQKMDEITKRLDKNETGRAHGIQDAQKRVEEKVDKLVVTMEIMEKQKQTEGHYVHECVEDAVKLQLQQDREEIEEINKRKACIIIHGLKESTEVDPVKRKESDEDEIVNMLHEINCDSVTVQTAIRLGKKDDTAGVKPRPVKLEVASEEQKEKILRLAKNLRGKKEKGLDKVFIHQDMTPKQRQQRKELVQQMKERLAKGEKNLIIVGGRIVVKRSKVAQAESN
jgi:hypothetical protein